LGCLSLCRVRPERHVALGLACPCPCPCPGQESGPRSHAGTPGTWAVCPGIGLDPSATWRWGWLSLPWAWARPAPLLGDTWRLGCLPLRWVRPKYHMALKLACPCNRREIAYPPTWGHLAPGLLALALG